MCGELGEELGFRVSRDMLRRFLKKLGYSWKRFRKSLRRLQDEQEYERKLHELQGLVALSQSGYIDLFFADEMEGYVPYGWQPRGEYIELTPQKSKGTQVFGLLSRRWWCSTTPPFTAHSRYLTSWKSGESSSFTSSFCPGTVPIST